MAAGDKAAALGWSTVSQTENVNNGATRINEALDRIADLYTDVRDNVKPAVNQPLFNVTRSTRVVGADANDWTLVPAIAYATPDIATGFTSWGDGILTVKKAGVYRLAAQLTWAQSTYRRTGLQIVRNTDTPSTVDGTLIQTITNGSETVTANATRRLAVGDKLRLLMYQAEDGGPRHGIDSDPFDLVFAVEWLRA